MSENGSNSEIFHKLCDNKGPTLTLISTTKNRIFGGFNPLNWKNKGGSIYDKSNQTFIFSLNLRKKYNMIDNKSKRAFYANLGGPNFGEVDFELGRDMKKGQTYSNNYSNFLKDNSLDLTGGKGDNAFFEVKELEIYKVLY